ncbi:hypothetical protein Hanom_Chr12g01115521 [Helianthus anomalus]
MMIINLHQHITSELQQEKIKHRFLEQIHHTKKHKHKHKHPIFVPSFSTNHQTS